jgi:hypothetical protein
MQLTVFDGEPLAALCQLGWARRQFLGPSAEAPKPQQFLSRLMHHIGRVKPIAIGLGKACRYPVQNWRNNQLLPQCIIERRFHLLLS